MSEENGGVSPAPEMRKIQTLKESAEIDREVAKRDDYYRVILHNDVQMVPILIKTSAWVLDENRVPVIRDGKRVRRSAVDAGLDVWAANGPEEYTLIMVLLGPMPMATIETIAVEMGLREKALQG